MSFRKQPKPDLDDKSKARQVTLMLNNLRGEQFRHEQNLSRRAHPPARALASTNPTLPFADIYDAPSPPHASPFATPRTRTPVRLNPGGVLEYDYPRGPVPGPPIPRSWSGVFAGDGADADGAQEADEEGRRAALALVFAHLPRSPSSAWAHGAADILPPLALLCLHALLAACGPAQVAEEVAPHVPAHVRRDYVRWAAVRAPLRSAYLVALCGAERACDGELVVVGPHASLPAHYFSAEKGKERERETGRADEEQGEEGEVTWDWDSPSAGLHAPPPLTTLVLLDAALPASALLALPPTLVRIALLRLRGPAPVFRLPRVCPLVEVAEFSFNPWLGEGAVIGRFDWARWGRLRVLGVRECGVHKRAVARVNEGRWTDVEVVGAEEGGADEERTRSVQRDASIWVWDDEGVREYDYS